VVTQDPSSGHHRHDDLARIDTPVHERHATVRLPVVREETAARPRIWLTPAHRRLITFLLLVAPIVILRLATAAYPIAQTASLSLTNSSLLSGTSEFIGLENYRAMPSDFGIVSAMRFTIIFVVGSTALQLIVGLLIALLLNARFRGQGLMRAVNLIPWAIPAIVAAYAFRWLLDDQFGLITHWLNTLTGQRLAPLSSAIGAQVSLILVNVWKNAPFMAVVFLAGLQGVPEDLYEAAKVDGATGWQRFWAITLPLMLPLLIAQGMFFLVWQLAAFDLIFGLTNGGPGVATVTLSLRIFQEGLLFFKYGFASAVSMVLMGLVAIVGLLGLIWFRRREVVL
jgi:multiple sugar transport system permease protein